MLVDTLLTFFVIRYAWRYPLWLCVFATGFFLLVDLAFFSADAAQGRRRRLVPARHRRRACSRS